MAADRVEELRDADDRMAEAIGSVTDEEPIEEWTCQNGLRLKLRRMPPRLLAQVVRHIEMPKIPIVTPEATGRPEENPDDPHYRKALEAWVVDRSEATFAAALTFASEPILPLPDDLIAPDDDAWIDLVQEIGIIAGEEIEVERTHPKRRYYDWLRFYAIDTEQDLFALGSILVSKVGITESEVMAEVETFRDILGRFPDLASSIFAWSGPDRDQDAAADPGADQ